MKASITRTRSTAPLAAVLACLALGLAPTSALEFHVNFDNVVLSVPCQGVLTSGGTSLLPITLYEASPAHNDPLLNILRAGLSQDTSGNIWDYQLANPVSGIMWVEWYKAIDVENGKNCDHGAQIAVHYNEAVPGLDWVQVVSGTTIPSHIDNADNTNRPYYFTPADDRSRFVSFPGLGTLTGSVFGDCPGWPNRDKEDAHLEANTFSYDSTFDLLLTGTTDTLNPDGTHSYMVSIYEDIRWGYVATCVPEPSTISLAVLGVVAILVIHHRRRRNPHARQE